MGLVSHMLSALFWLAATGCESTSHWHLQVVSRFLFGSYRLSALFSSAATSFDPFSGWQLWGQLAYFLDVSNVARNALAVP